MKSKFNRPLFMLLIVLTFYGFLRILNIVSFNKIGTVNMEPNYKVDQLVFASNLIKHDRGSVVMFNSKTIERPNSKSIEGNFIGRIVAKGGDEMEIRDGYTYVNGILAEENLDLQFLYKTKPEFFELNNEFFQSDLNEYRFFGRSKQLVFLADSELINLQGLELLEKYNSPFEYNQIEFLSDKPDGWSAINYGPLKIPDGNFFILGDNRHNSEDSRQKGFVKEDDILTTVYE